MESDTKTALRALLDPGHARKIWITRGRDVMQRVDRYGPPRRRNTWGMENTSPKLEKNITIRTANGRNTQKFARVLNISRPFPALIGRHYNINAARSYSPAAFWRGI